MTPARTRARDRLALGKIGAEVVPRGGWHGRRRAAALLLAAAALVAVALGTGWPQADAPVWSIVVGLAAVVGAMTLSTFVAIPGTGRLVEVGCGSCAMVSGMAPVLAMWWVATSPVDLWSAVLALGITGATLVKRLTDPVACERTGR